MARIGVLHNTLDNRGGADAVCLHVCEALQSVHDVRLHTLSHPPLAALNELFDTDTEVPIETPPIASRLADAIGRAERVVGPQLAAYSALLVRSVWDRVSEYDALVSTANEFQLPTPSLQYVHYPQFHPPGDVWGRLAGVRRLSADARLLANSTYTARAVERRYGRRPTVCHPPVDPIPGGRPWADREPGLVVVGRIAADNRLFTALRIVDELRDRGYRLPLRLVGSTSARADGYCRRLRRGVERRPYVTLQTNLPREQLHELLGRYRYGLNVRRHETFGMALAEYVAAGMIGFAPDAGGQRDVLAGDSRRLFDTPDEAAELIGAAIDRDDRPERSRDRFGVDRFHEAIRNHLATLL